MRPTRTRSRPDPPSFRSTPRPCRALDALVSSLAIAIALITPTPTLASDDGSRWIGPGSADLRLDALRPFEAVYTDQRGPSSGSRVHRLERLSVRETAALRFTISMHGRGVVEDELTFDAHSGAPLARRIFAPSLVHRVETWQGSVLRWVDVAVDGSGAQPHDKHFEVVPLTLPPDLLVAALALEPGDRRFVPSFSTDLGSEAPGFLLDLEALGPETITTAAGRFECLRVRTEMRALPTPLEGADPEQAATLGLPARTLWIHPEAPYLIRASAQIAGTELVQELEQIRWLGPDPAAGQASTHGEGPAAAHHLAASSRRDAAHEGLLHRLVDWVHGLHGHHRR